MFISSQVWWGTPINPAVGGEDGDQEFRVILGYVNSRPLRIVKPWCPRPKEINFWLPSVVQSCSVVAFRVTDRKSRTDCLRNQRLCCMPSSHLLRPLRTRDKHHLPCRGQCCPRRDWCRKECELTRKKKIFLYSLKTLTTYLYLFKMSYLITACYLHLILFNYHI